jgi:hypothetical protein
MPVQSVNFSRFAMIMTVMVMLVVSGCRQAPENPPKYYQAEIREMERQAAMQANNENHKFLEDRYPWEGKTSSLNCVPCRIQDKEKVLNSELDYLHTFIHGKKRNRRRLRD